MGRALQKSPAPRRLAVVAALATSLGLAVAGCSAGQVTQTDTQVAAVNGASGQSGDIAVRDAQLLFPLAHGAYEDGDDAPVVVVIANNGTGADKLLAVTSDATGPAEITGDSVLEPGTVLLAEADQDDAGSHSSTGNPSSTGKPSSSSVAGSSSVSSPPGSGSATTTTTTTPSASGATTTTTGSATPTSGSGTSISAPPTTGTKMPSSVDPTEPGVVKIVLKGLKKQLRPGETIRVTFLFQEAGEITLELPIGATPEARHDEPSEH